MEASKVRKQVVGIIDEHAAKVKRAVSILDLGCGRDKIVPYATGVDFFTRGVMPGPKDVHGDVTDLHWISNNSIDIVFSSHTLEDIKDTHKVLKEWLRVLRPGGLLILYLPHRDYYPNIGHPLANKGHRHDFVPLDIHNAMTVINSKAVCELDEVHAPPNGKYDYNNRAKIEYSFLMIWRKV